MAKINIDDSILDEVKMIIVDVSHLHEEIFPTYKFIYDEDECIVINKLINAFPTSVNQIQLSWGSADAVARVIVTIAYDYWERIDSPWQLKCYHNVFRSLYRNKTNYYREIRKVSLAMYGIEQ